jgi:predicted transposase/invertase (TIGR01784 family)
MSKYINPYTDFGFKKLFGEEGNKALLIDFLNQLMPPHHQISEITFQNVESLPDSSEERKAFFDIHCKAESGERFIVEMQKAKVAYFKDRSMYYITYPIREQAHRGDWDFKLSAIYFIGVLDFFYEPEKIAVFHRDVVLKDQFNKPFYDKLQITYLQMPAFNKKENELENHFDKWAYFLKNLEQFEDIPQILNEPIFTQAFQTAKVANFSQQQRIEYEKSRLVYIGIKQVTATAEEDGLQKGLQKGLEIATAKAAEEAEKKEIAIIMEMHREGISIAQIAKINKKTTTEIEEIIAIL